MKTVIIGGGRGCEAIIDLATSTFLKELTLDIECVMDIDPTAPGIQRARELRIDTSDNLEEVLSLEGVELVIELTGRNDVLQHIHRILPAGVTLVDHTFAHIFWDLVNAQQQREWQLHEMTQLEREVEKEQSFLQSLFDTIPDVVLVYDANKRPLRVNAAYARFAGVAQGEDAIGRRDLLEGTELAFFALDHQKALDQVLKSRRPRSVICQTAEPEEAFWEVTHTPILNGNGEPEAIVGTFHRITERVKLYRQIERAEQQFKSFIDSAHDWISIKDISGRYVIVNPVCAHAFDREPEDFVGRLPEEVLPAEICRTIKVHDKQVIDCDCHQTYEEVYHLHGRDHHFQTVRFPLADHHGDVMGVCTIARDVTSERELRDQLVQAGKLAAVGKLAAGVAHEINNPLTGVLAFAEDMLSDLPQDHPHRDDLGVIIRETMRCREIVRNLLDFARLEKLVLAVTSPNTVIQQALQLVHRLPQFRNITIQLQQVVLNMMMNSADAMSGVGAIKLSSAYRKRTDKCVITVEDNGPGIPKDLRDRIFEPFFTTKKTSGLGLAVSWGIVERHQGTIETAEAKDGGAIFRIVLPAVEPTDHDQS
jgi:two-component system NtrC family sensor kinase